MIKANKDRLTVSGELDVVMAEFMCISNLEIYETPENLSTFGMSRPPQSWCYVEDLTWTLT